MSIRQLLLCAVACTVLAGCSLLLADEPVYDAWGWLVWGREIAHLGLDATAGPSWKPLPVLLTAPLSLAGDAAPQLWLVLVRSAWLLSLVLAFELAHRLAIGRSAGPRIAAGAFAALGLALLSDDMTAWARQAAGGLSEPLLVALVLGAVRCAIDGYRRAALVVGALVLLLRPEAWPLLAAYGLWCAREDRGMRPLVAAVTLAPALLWLAPELLGPGSGSVERARSRTSDPLRSLAAAAALPLAVAWPLALATLRRRCARVLAGGALAWIVLVALLTAVGFAGLARFMTPAAAIVCVLGGVGLTAPAWRARGPLAAALLAALVVTAAGLPGRVYELAWAWPEAARLGESHDSLRALTRTVGAGPLLRCGRLATDGVIVRTALAWELGVPVSRIVSFGSPPRLSGTFVFGPDPSLLPRPRVPSAARLLGRSGGWSIYATDCR